MPTICLVRPQIAPNTGNIGRLCVGYDARLELVGPKGFEITDKQLKRAGLDYWPKLDWQEHPDEESYREQLQPEHTVLFTKTGHTAIGELDFTKYSHFVFGSETRGLSPEWYTGRFQTCWIPSTANVRSYNLSNTVAMVLALHAQATKHWAQLGRPAETTILGKPD